MLNSHCTWHIYRSDVIKILSFFCVARLANYANWICKGHKIKILNLFVLCLFNVWRKLWRLFLKPEQIKKFSFFYHHQIFILRECLWSPWVCCSWISFWNFVCKNFLKSSWETFPGNRLIRPSKFLHSWWWKNICLHFLDLNENELNQISL